MATIFIVGETGNSDLWLVDTGARTVQPLARGEAGGFDTQTIEAARENGFSIEKNVDVAIAASTSEDATARMLTSRMLATPMPTARQLTGN
ncbi:MULTISPECIES: hypothetical protein [unclassified Aureimonas]|uniref:hypothetical protein n=1 Tax=unclassified Aureimonas TaxID=2615206 RepID=UPI0006F6B8C4|nr:MULTISPECIES: hypothetical protein [unclassified Aureimonas]KQT69085.1 hypothetical protein ASG54_05410 [Aureimonas sp. Leaf460]KQT69323.1 hypothetical protein ASG62_18015 [Aureimonas sp. Leaf427]